MKYSWGLWHCHLLSHLHHESIRNSHPVAYDAYRRLSRSVPRPRHRVNPCLWRMDQPSNTQHSVLFPDSAPMARAPSKDEIPQELFRALSTRQFRVPGWRLASFGETFSLKTCSFRVFSWHSFFRPWTVSFPTGDYINLLNENGWYRIHTGITLKEKKVPLRLPLIKNAAMENQNIIVSTFPTVIILKTKLKNGKQFYAYFSR